MLLLGVDSFVARPWVWYTHSRLCESYQDFWEQAKLKRQETKLRSRELPALNYCSCYFQGSSQEQMMDDGGIVGEAVRREVAR